MGAKPRRALALGGDLIEAGLNEPLPRPSNGRDSKLMIFDDRQAQTHAQLLRMARMLLTGGPRSLVSRPQQSSLYWALKCILQITRSAILVLIVLAQLLEPPCTDPYARWCGRGGAARLPPIPINLESQQALDDSPKGISRVVTPI